MRVFKIQGNIIEKYHGAGHALASIVGEAITGLVYIADVIPDYGDEQGMETLAGVIADERLGPTVRELSALGEVSVGMCSCYEFCEL